MNRGQQTVSGDTDKLRDHAIVKFLDRCFSTWQTSIISCSKQPAGGQASMAFINMPWFGRGYPETQKFPDLITADSATFGGEFGEYFESDGTSIDELAASRTMDNSIHSRIASKALICSNSGNRGQILFLCFRVATLPCRASGTIRRPFGSFCCIPPKLFFKIHLQKHHFSDAKICTPATFEPNKKRIFFPTCGKDKCPES